MRFLMLTWKYEFLYEVHDILMRVTFFADKWQMIEMNAVLYRKKQCGHLPGIDVGYQFYSRAGMAALGFHSQCFSGIDYIGKSSKQFKDRVEIAQKDDTILMLHNLDPEDVSGEVEEILMCIIYSSCF